jgi:hypothetical protein
VPDVKVRVGDYRFDNTNYVGSAFPFAGRYNTGPFPIEDLYASLRHHLWLATDSAYKSAVEALSRKRAAIRNIAANEQVADFARAEPLRSLEGPVPGEFETSAWTGLVRMLSAVFAAYPDVQHSDVNLNASRNFRRFVNTEGTEVSFPELALLIRVRGEAQAPDGMKVRDWATVHSATLNGLPAERELRQVVQTVAENLTALTKAPVGETYTGPVIFEGTAAAQAFAELLGRHFALPRRPVTEPGRPGAFPFSDLDGRQGARILPEWMNVADDASQAEWRGRRLFGHYRVDREGVPPQPLLLVENGILKGFLLTRQPVRGYSGSNGRARLPGSFGAHAATISNLFVRAAETLPLPELKKRLLQICETRNKPYGIIVRKMDFPTSASMDELRRIFTQQGGARPVSSPLLTYRVYPDGREELVRGLRFRGLNARSLKDILAAGSDENVFDYMENNAPFAMMGAAGYSAECSVVAPSILVDDLELHRIEDEHPNLPIVPPPDLRGAQL